LPRSATGAITSTRSGWICTSFTIGVPQTNSPVGLDRIGNVVSITARRRTVVAGLALEHDPPALGERLLRGLTEMCRRSTPFGPGRGRGEPSARRRRREDDADPDTGNHAALIASQPR